MVSHNEAGFNLREMAPLPRNILHTRENGTHGSTGQRTNLDREYDGRGCRGRTEDDTDQKVEAGYLNYPASVRDTAKSGMGCVDNRHLNYLAKSIYVNVGGFRPDAKASSRPMSDGSVGAVIVVVGVTTPSRSTGKPCAGRRTAVSWEFPSKGNRMRTGRNLHECR
jgi:hypothetical protein